MQKAKLHNIFVRGLDKTTKDYIKDRAKKNDRSVSKEIIKILKTLEVGDNPYKQKN